MERRKFLAGAGLAGAAGAATLASPALAQRRKEWICVSAFGKAGLLGSALERFAAFVGRASGGSLTIDVFHAGELVPAFEAMDAVQSGGAQMGFGAPYYWAGKSDAISFVATIPFGLTAQEQNAWCYYGGGIELADQHAYAGLGLKFLPMGNTGNQMGGWYAKEVNTVEDLKGLNFRMPGLGGEILKTFDVTVVLLPGPDVLVALTTGRIDGTEWIGPAADLGKGLYQAAKYYYTPGWHEPATILDGFFDAAEWDGLSEEHRAIVEAGAAAMNQLVLAEYQAKNNEALQTLVNDHEVEVRAYSDELMTAFGARAAEVLPQLASASADATALFNHIVEFRSRMKEWSAVSDGAFLAARGAAAFTPITAE